MSDPTVTVVGHGTATTVPDVLRVEFGVECTAAAVADALAEANTALDALVGAVVDGGTAPADVQTGGLSVGPRYGDHGPDGAPIVGYTVSHTVTAVLRDLATASGILTAAATAGGDATRIGAVSMAVSDPAPAQAAARDAAYTDAVARARRYAELAGARLGRAVTISEVGGTPRPAAAAFKAAAIHPGTDEITASVTVTFELVASDPTD